VAAAGAWCSGVGFAVGASPPDTATRIREALRERRVVRFRYFGLAREAEPHALGIGRSGQRVLLAWQAAGGSRSEPPPGWRTFALGAMQGVRVQRRTFVPRGDFAPEKCGLQSVEQAVSTATPRAP
jgi:hypothetical protein